MSNNEPTHVVTTPNQNTIASLKQSLAGDALKQVISYYGGNNEEGMRFMTAAVEYCRKTPELLACNRTSLVMALVTAAQFRFMPSNVSGEAYILPYKKEAKFQMGYQGYVTLIYRTGKVKAIQSNIVYSNDLFEYEEGLNPVLKHIPAKFGTPRGEPIGVYTVAQMDGGAKTFKVMSKDQVMAIKELSKAKNEKFSPWNSNDPELWMWRKTCLIQHRKFLPMTPDLQRALEKDFEGEGLDKANLDTDGPATVKAFHGGIPVIAVEPEQPVSPASTDTPPDEIFEEPSINL